MDSTQEDARCRKAIDYAIASNGLSGFTPTAFGLAIFELWIAHQITAPAVIHLLKQHHAALEQAGAATSDGQAQDNLLKITDSKRLKDYEADVTTMRMAELAF